MEGRKGSQGRVEMGKEESTGHLRELREGRKGSQGRVEMGKEERVQDI